MPPIVDSTTPERLRSLIGNVEFPALKDEIVRAARRNRATDEVVSLLQTMTATEFRSFDELLEAYTGGGTTLSGSDVRDRSVPVRPPHEGSRNAEAS